MKLSTIVLGLASVLPATATVSFAATGYAFGCSPGGCSNGFNVSAPAEYLNGAPAFNFHCNTILTRSYVPCAAIGAQTSEVSAQWLIMPAPYPYGSEGIWVSHVYKGTDGVTVNATGFFGYNSQSESPKSFALGLVSVK